MTRRATVPLLLGLLALLASPAVAAPARWWDRKWPLRKHLRLTERQRWGKSPSARVRFGTGGRAREDFADLRVVTADRDEVPHAVVASGPGDAVEIVFPVEGHSEWFVYYGNLDAKPPRRTFTPDRGLVLSTRARGAGNPNGWPAMEKILERSTRVFGGATWKRVFDAINPFGPSDDFVSEYRGFILAPKAGTFTFYTASDEASFLFVAGKLVVQWPGWHGASRGAWARYRGTIELTAGLHPFRYVHVERTGAQVMAAYWQPPGAKKPVVIPESAFPGHRTVGILTHEALGKKVAADFGSVPTDKWGRDGRVYSGITITARPTGRTPRYEWDFGDGVTGEGVAVYHVYLSGGTYRVRLTVREDGTEDTVVRTLRIPGEWTRFDRNRDRVLEQMGRIVAKYPGNRLDGKALARAIYLLDQAGLGGDAIRLLDSAVRTSTLLSDADEFSFAMDLGRRCVEGPGDLAPAGRAFRKAIDDAVDEKQETRARLALADAMIRLGGDHREAGKGLESLVREKAARQGSLGRLAWLRLGDARMLDGDGDGARVAYEKSEKLAGGAEDVRRLLRKAAAARTTLTHIEAGRPREALKSLAAWEWEAPTERYSGLHRIASAKVLLGLARVEGAVRELLTLVDANPGSEYADQALFLLSEIERKRGNVEATDGYLERLRREYPWSPYGAK